MTRIGSDITHPKVADAAVFGLPKDDLGEEVKAVVQLMPDISAGPEIVEELMAFCHALGTPEMSVLN
jgi:long-chain acyl-CoA synthetase